MPLRKSWEQECSLVIAEQTELLLLPYRLVVISVKLLLLSLHQRTPLCLSARKDNIEILKYLSDKGADVNVKDDGGVSE